MKVTIVTGMLGAGKTTFIQHYIKNSSEKTVILVNDFGKTGIDGEVLSQVNPDTIELPSGCVCCSLKFDLITTLQRIQNELFPEHLLIEPSGIASVSAVEEALFQSGIKHFTVVTVIDSVDFLEYYNSQEYGAFFEDQIINADLLLINKIDLVKPEVILKTREVLYNLNPSAIIIPTVKAKIHKEISLSQNAKTPQSSINHLHIESLAVDLPDGIKKEDIEALFKGFAAQRTSSVLRAKAIIKEQKGSFLVDLASGKCFSKRLHKDTDRSRMVIIFKDLDSEALRSEVVALLNKRG